MALNFITGLDVKGNINLNKKELRNAVIQNLATDPGAGSSEVGQIYFNTNIDTLKQYVEDSDGLGNPGWIEVGTTSGVETVTTTDGTYINLTPNSATNGNVTVTADLSAVDGSAASSTRFLSKDNTWDVPAFSTVNDGTLTLITAAGLDGGGTFSANQAGNTTFGLSLDLSELADMTQAMLSTDEFIVLDSSVQKRKQASEIGNSIFNNTAGYITSASLPTVSNAAITIGAGTNLTGGGIFTLNQASAETITVNMDTGGIGAGIYGSTSNSVKVDTIAVDQYGRVTAITTGATGQVNSVATSNAATISIGGSSINRTVTAITAAVANGGAALATGDQIYDFVTAQIGNLPSGLAFEGNWNANTDNPDLSGLSPENGQFWICTVAGNTDLDGITDWKVGDWAIYVSTGAGTDGWQKIDNTSTLDGAGVAGQVSFWSGTTNIAGDAGFTYDSSLNNLSVGNKITAGGAMFATGGNSTEWNTSYDNMITALNVAGTTTKTLTATQQDGGTLTASWTDNNTEYVMMTATTLGLGKLEDNTTQTVAANTVSSTAARTYGIQKNSSNQLVVNVPWTDSQNLVSSVDESTANNLKGITVNPTTGNVKVGLNINGLAAIGTPVGADTLPIYDSGTNKKVSITQLAAATQGISSYAVTISNTATITHGLGSKDVIIQLYDVSTAETVYADVVRASTNTALITFTSTPANSIRVMVQKVIA